jgi:hypothetical protein
MAAHGGGTRNKMSLIPLSELASENPVSGEVLQYLMHIRRYPRAPQG